MRERPMQFNGAMVRVTLGSKKPQIRRAVKPVQEATETGKTLPRVGDGSQ